MKLNDVDCNCASPRLGVEERIMPSGSPLIAPLWEVRLVCRNCGRRSHWCRSLEEAVDMWPWRNREVDVGSTEEPTSQETVFLPPVVYLDSPVDVPTAGNRFIVCVERNFLHQWKDGQVFLTRTSRLAGLFAEYPRWLKEAKEHRKDRLDLVFLDGDDMDLLIDATYGFLRREGETIQRGDGDCFTIQDAIDVCGMANIYLRRMGQ